MGEFIKSVFLIVPVCILLLIVSSSTIHVPGDQLTIETGIDAAVDGDTIEWYEPLLGSPLAYLIFWQDDMGDILGQRYIGDTSYTINEDLLGIGLWFGVSAYDENGVFGKPEFIEM